jgi:hypothetical protein
MAYMSAASGGINTYVKRYGLLVHKAGKAVGTAALRKKASRFKSFKHLVHYSFSFVLIVVYYGATYNIKDFMLNSQQ